MSQIKYRKDIPTLKSTDKISEAFETVRASGFGALPVVKHHRLIGMLHESDEVLLKAAEQHPSKTLGTVEFAEPPALRCDAHPLELIKMFRKNPLLLLPVVGNSSTYLGVALRADAEQQVKELFSLSSDGVLIELETPVPLRLSELVRLLEQNEAQVLTLAVRRLPNSTDTQFIVLHLQVPDAYRLQRTLERYGYAVTYNSQAGESLLDDSALKAQEFLRYLEL
jgi:acetoin utilization protein AcuB